MKCGGTTPTEITDELRKICESHRGGIEKTSQRLGRNGLLTTFEPVGALSQVVAGVNYFITIRVGDTEYIWVRIHQDLQGETHLHAVNVNKGVGDNLEYFEAGH